jgi:hypothetical protein
MATRICNGNQDCLHQVGYSRGQRWYDKNPEVECLHGCEPNKCANYQVCKNDGPTWVVNFKNGCCISCSRDFGKVLEFSEDECPVCLETKTCVTMMNCSHKECVDCFNRMQYGAEPPPQPEFPLPDKWDEYEEGLLDNHPLIVQWNRKMEKWHDDRSRERRNEQNLRCCPLCRK